MSCYVELEMNCTTYTELTDFLMELVTKLDNAYEVISLVHLIDFLDEERERYRAKENKSLQRYREVQELFKETYNGRNVTTDDFRYYKLEKLFRDYGVDLDVETEFHLIMEIMDQFKDDEDDAE